MSRRPGGYVGHDELATRLPGVLPLEAGGQLSDYVDTALELLLQGAPDGPPPPPGGLPAADR